METNDLLNFSIPRHGGFGKTYEESIITEINISDFWYAAHRRKDYFFIYDNETNRICLIGFNKNYEIMNGVWIKYEDVINDNNNRFQKLELLSVLPISENYALVELIDPEILKCHLDQERMLKLEKRY